MDVSRHDQESAAAQHALAGIALMLIALGLALWFESKNAGVFHRRLTAERRRRYEAERLLEQRTEQLDGALATIHEKSEELKRGNGTDAGSGTERADELAAD